MTEALFEHLQQLVDRGREIQKEIEGLRRVDETCCDSRTLIRPWSAGVDCSSELIPLDASMRVKYRGAISERIVELQEEFRRLGREIQLVDPATKRRVFTPACDDEEST